MEYLLGIDIGTSSAKTLATTPEGQILAQTSRSYPMHQPRPGRREQDAKVVAEAVEDAVAAVIEQLGKQPLALSFSSAMHSLLLLDESGDPLAPLLTWADQRSAGQAQRLRNSKQGQQIYEATGTPLHPMSPLCKLIWMRETDFTPYNRAAQIVTIKSFLFYRWFGRYLIDESDASATGLFDIINKEWYAPALQEAGVRSSQLPAPVKTTTAYRGMHQEVASRLGLAPETPVVIGASDGCLANLGSGVMEPGAVALTIGTSGAIRITRDHPLIDEQGRLFNYILDEEHYVCGGPVNNGGYLLEWFQEKLADNRSVEKLMEQAAQLPPGAEGLLCLPYLLGERAPVWDGRARGAFVGLTDRHGQGHLFRALLESIGFNLFQVGQLMEENGARFEFIRASGGLIRSPLWQQILSDIFNLPLLVEKREDASARGAILLASQALGMEQAKIPDPSSIPEEDCYAPNPGRNKTYRRYYEVYKELYPQLRASFQALEDL